MRACLRLFLAFAFVLPCGTALAQNLVSGGATLPAPLYQDAMADLPGGGLQPYAGAGSVAGLRAFLLNDPGAFNRTGAVHWAGSELPLTQAQIAAYLVDGWGRQGSPASHGPLIQLPAAYVPITIAYKGPTQPVTLTRDQLCAVFGGAIDRWSQLGVTVPASLDAFKLVYRADGSGTSQLLTRHLREACRVNAPKAFSGKEVFPDEFAPGDLPAHFVAVQGDSGAAVAMAGHVSAITYIGPDATYSGGLKQAWLVNGNDGVAYSPTPANVVAAMESDGAPGWPGGQVIARSPAAALWASADNAANPSNWVRIQPDPRTGYPIVGSTNIVLSQCYSDPAAAAAMRLFLTRLYNDTARVANHQLVPLPAMLRARLLATFVAPAGTAARLNIGNATVCGDIAGRG